jgi:hypothetical protein
MITSRSAIVLDALRYGSRQSWYNGSSVSKTINSGRPANLAVLWNLRPGAFETIHNNNETNNNKQRWVFSIMKPTWCTEHHLLIPLIGRPVFVHPWGDVRQLVNVPEGEKNEKFSCNMWILSTNGYMAFSLYEPKLKVEQSVCRVQIPKCEQTIRPWLSARHCPLQYIWHSVHVREKRNET